MIDKIKGLFDLDNPFYSFGKKLVIVLVLNFVFILTCIPIVTIGASMTAMNGVFMKVINERDVNPFTEYFVIFKQNFLKSTPIWLLSMLIMTIMYVDMYYWFNIGIKEGPYAYVMIALSAVVIVFFLMVLHTVFPLIARFDMTVKEYIINAVRITLKDLLLSFEGLFFTVAIVGFTFYMVLTATWLIMVYMILMCFGLNGLAQAYIYRKVLNKYSEEYVEMIKKYIAEEEMESEE